LPADPAAVEFAAERFAVVIGILNELDKTAAGRADAGDASSGEPARDSAPSELARQLQQGLVELDAQREAIANEQLALSAQVKKFAAELARIRETWLGRVSADADRKLAIVVLSEEISRCEQVSDYVASLYGGYLRNLEARSKADDAGSWARQIRAALGVSANPEIGAEEVFAAQTAAISRSIDRLEDALGRVESPPVREARKR
jgi:hypothetical protein